MKDELRVFLGSRPRLQEIEDYLPTQRGKVLDGASLELKEHQKEALEALRAMRERRETIALLCHATGTGKTVTAVLDATRFLWWEPSSSISMATLRPLLSRRKSAYRLF